METSVPQNESLTFFSLLICWSKSEFDFVKPQALTEKLFGKLV